MKPFESLDLTPYYIKHDVPVYAHDHPTEPDGINASTKALETALKAFDIDGYILPETRRIFFVHDPDSLAGFSSPPTLEEVEAEMGEASNHPTGHAELYVSPSLITLFVSDGDAWHFLPGFEQVMPGS